MRRHCVRDGNNRIDSGMLSVIVYESGGAVAVYKEGHCQVAKSGVVVTLVKVNKLAPIQVRTIA